MTVTLAGGGYRLALDPERGGAVLSADWSSVEGKTVPLLVPQTDSLPAFKGGCFAMLPFANRIAEG
ncbi:aldose 1-epimerase, partial [Salmonella enterica subsp. enterica]|nr:aldose 1-epimerase [Salmonella enterica subsp. enterica serovar Enteritidis]